MAAAEQSFANHTRIVPLYHFGIYGILAVNLLWQAYRLVTRFSLDQVVTMLVAVALPLIALYARVFALRAQDRVIRLEERLRMQEVLPAELRGPARTLHAGQLIGLRFASDEELPELVRWVLAEDVRDRRAIKARIRSWRADHLRA
jgi:hypothetical protein